MKHLLFATLLLLTIGSKAQNLAPNGILEYNDTCSPGSLTTIVFPSPWYRAYGSVDYFHPCKTSGNTSPNNVFGIQIPRSDEAYIGCYNYLTFWRYREYASVELTDILVAGDKYLVEFYVSLSDSAWYATKNIGMYFSENVVVSNLDTILNKDPQVKYTGTDYLTDRENWIKVEGTYTAQGGEKYITVGNFVDDENIDTVFVPGGGAFRPNEPDIWKFAYYYIDDISVIKDTGVGVHELEKGDDFLLYPNPNDGNMYLEYRNLTEAARFEIYDMTGRKISTYSLNSEYGKLNISERGLSSGVYMYRIINDNYKYAFGKVVIRK